MWKLQDLWRWLLRPNLDGRLPALPALPNLIGKRRPKVDAMSANKVLVWKDAQEYVTFPFLKTTDRLLNRRILVDLDSESNEAKQKVSCLR